MHILVVEDDMKVASFLRRELLKQSYVIDIAKDGEEALYKIDINTYDLVILDIMMPKKSGIEVCLGIRERNIHVPILLLTGETNVQSKIKGLDAGADDYLTKPFSLGELLARMRALLRRGSKVRPTKLTIDNLELNPATRGVRRGGKAIYVTAKEYAVLEYFMRNSNVLLTKTEILEHVWDYNYDGMSNIIETYVKNLRKKLKTQPSDKNLIHTIRGGGYILHT